MSEVLELWEFAKTKAEHIHVIQEIDENNLSIEAVTEFLTCITDNPLLLTLLRHMMKNEKDNEGILKCSWYTCICQLYMYHRCIANMWTVYVNKLYSMFTFTFSHRNKDCSKSRLA